MTLPDDPTLDELRLALAPAVADAAVFDGWSQAAVASAAAARGIDPRLAQAASAEGSMQMVSAWVASIDAAMAEALPQEALAALPIRERIRRLVTFRLEAAAGKREALRRALAIMAMPQNAKTAITLGWRSADAMWRLAGDTATDFNHYSKRAILGSIYAATLSVLAGDDSEGQAETRAFLDRRIEGIMRFEKTKAQLLRPRDERFSLVRMMGRLRYPAR